MGSTRVAGAARHVPHARRPDELPASARAFRRFRHPPRDRSTWRSPSCRRPLSRRRRPRRSRPLDRRRLRRARAAIGSRFGHRSSRYPPLAPVAPPPRRRFGAGRLSQAGDRGARRRCPTPPAAAASAGRALDREHEEHERIRRAIERLARPPRARAIRFRDHAAKHWAAETRAPARSTSRCRRSPRRSATAASRSSRSPASRSRPMAAPRSS